MTAFDAVTLGALVGSIACADIRWLRVAQREHYLGGAGTRFWWRWWTSTPVNVALALLSVAGAAVSVIEPVAAVTTAVAVGMGPVGLHLRGRTSRLAWTRRLWLVAFVTGSLEVLAIAVSGARGGFAWSVPAAAFAALGVPFLLDAALIALRPVEDLLADRFVRSAAKVLARVQPVVVGITGSYGKTTTKGYVAHLLAADRDVVASPKSFNNRAGLARTVNDHLAPGTEVLVAEMGAYGPGEIAALCRWLAPEVAVITAIGPAHLERFRTLDRTLAAKAEITSGARTVVLNVDDERLEGLARRLEGTQKVLRASGQKDDSDVAVLASGVGLELRLAGTTFGVAVLPSGSPPPVRSNAACAVAVALELGVPPEVVLERLSGLPTAPNRLQRYVGDAGYVVLDDTFNSNPAGARRALEALELEAPAGRRVLVTPGMVELGRAQRDENAAFAEAAAQVASHVVVVGRTNRVGLVEGCRRAVSPPEVKLVPTRDAAVAWVRSTFGPGDAVLFENDLPDHFP